MAQLTHIALFYLYYNFSSDKLIVQRVKGLAADDLDYCLDWVLH